MNHYQRSLNQMPAAFRRRTTDAHLMTFQKLLAATEKDRQKEMIEEAAAKKIAVASPLFQVVEDKRYANETFSTLEGRNFLNQEGARQVFINICRQSDPDIAAQVITVWRHPTWIPIKEIDTTVV